MATLEIKRDQDPESPREWDNLGTMVCWHGRYRLGDNMPLGDAKEWFDENVPKGSVVLPLYLYDHSGITMSTGAFSCPWDSGQVGWIFVTPEKIRKEFNCKVITKRIREKAERCLQQEVKTYDHYLTGNVWGYIYDHDSGECDSCWGFFGDELGETGIGESVPSAASEALVAAAWEARS